MIEARADAIIPATADSVFAAVTDFDAADWLPTVRRLHHVGGPRQGEGARYDVEVGLVGRHLRGVLVCREFVAGARMVLALEDGLDLTVTVTLHPVHGGCRLELIACYAVGPGPLATAVARASAGAARREAARAVEQIAVRFRRPTSTMS